MSPPPVLVLASTSRYRRELLAAAGIAAATIAPTFDERQLDAQVGEWSPEQLAVEVARGKARSVTAPPGAWVLAADQLVVLDGRLLTKPGTVERAVAQLTAMAGRSHRLVNGLVLRNPATGAELTAVDVHEVRMRAYDEATAREYVERCRPLDCVGAYRIEDDADLIETVEGGDRTGVVGLPIPVVEDLLRDAGIGP